ncbi:uncharacterized protein B0I36DRAFT_242105 [Microdochium trichocladiopsis]|uniref:SH3 domain-containing protein n=1 Tax=Microdochium trichocladiopsis TaxID=1682393 RepID=A0A9P8Y726_9PEZI|nr:uncharacterized protein B0I36DRAFT_242105 [Microdochium trichocladiopsis]KAH7031152.1 hypothetical protein B0I36DRAFT_242105 [Microdochium trichocladiopsis]
MALVTVLSLAPVALGQSSCISLAGSSGCKAFSGASVGKTEFLLNHYPFLQYVSDTASFDQQLDLYVRDTYVQRQFQGRFGCDNVNLANTSDYYARFTKSVICNGIVQNSIQACGLSTQQSAPLCAASCAEYAQSEAMIVADNNLCANPVGNIQELVRADFADCAVPARSLSSGGCITAISNEPDNCGYGSSTLGICSYCASGGINSTDTCCYSSNTESLCANVVLPTIVPTLTFSTPLPTSTSEPTSTNSAGASDGSNRNMGLSGGAIAGIVIGCIAGIVLIALAVLLCMRSRRNRQGSQKGSVFNQPSPSRKGPQTTKIPASNTPPQGYEVLPGGRIARMSALEGHSGDSPSRHSGSRHGTSTGAAAAGGATGYMLGRRRGNSSSDFSGESPGPETRSAVLRPPPTSRRQGSLSSNSILAGDDPSSPTSAGGLSSAAGMTSQQSEQLPFFKDYYSQDDIHPGERVAVLWAYQPRAQDEFSLERGDMIKVVGIWDDGWATGIMTDERADEWEIRRQAQRDSGVSNASGRGRDNSPPVSGEIKAFPLVCVCLPDHWRKTIEGDGSTETGSGH